MKWSLIVSISLVCGAIMGACTVQRNLSSVGIIWLSLLISIGSVYAVLRVGLPPLLTGGYMGALIGLTQSLVILTLWNQYAIHNSSSVSLLGGTTSEAKLAFWHGIVPIALVWSIWLGLLSLACSVGVRRFGKPPSTT